MKSNLQLRGITQTGDRIFQARCVGEQRRRCDSARFVCFEDAAIDARREAKIVGVDD
jgi:hypothetical protein